MKLNYHPVCELEPRLWLVWERTDKPKLAWQVADDELIKAGTGVLHRELDADNLTPHVRATWAAAVDDYLRDPGNDCLRARGDVCWQCACRAHMLLTER